MNDIVDVNTLFGPPPASSTDLPVDELLSLMQKHSIRACCTMSTVGMLLDHTAGNSATLAACREYPALIPVATVNPLSYFGGEGPAEQFVQEKFRMVRFFPTSQGWPVRFAPFRTLVRTLASKHLPIMVDVTGPGMATDLADMMSDVDCRVVLAGVDDRQVSEAVAVLRAMRGFYVETSGLTAVGALRLLEAGVGAERLLFGSAAPGRPVASALATVRHAGLSEEDQTAILGANARALLNLEPQE